MPALKMDKKVNKQYVADISKILSVEIKKGDELGKIRFQNSIRKLLAELPSKAVEGEKNMRMANEFRDIVVRVPSFIATSILFNTRITAFDIFRVFSGLYPEAYYGTDSAFPEEDKTEWMEQFSMRACWYMSREDFDVVAKMNTIKTNDPQNSLMLALIYSEAKKPKTFLGYYHQMKDAINDPCSLIIPAVCGEEAQKEMEAFNEIDNMLVKLIKQIKIMNGDYKGD